MSELIDHGAHGRDRVALQYTESPKMLAFLQAILAPIDELEAVFRKINDQLDIDLAEGVNLDILGDIEGASRLVINGLLLPFFGFTDTPGAIRFGEETDPSIGGRWYEEGTPTTGGVSLGDPEFRRIIRARIVYNVSRGRMEDCYNTLTAVFPGVQMHIFDGGSDVSNPMSIEITVGKLLTFLEQAIIKTPGVIVKPFGVRVFKWYHYDPGAGFGSRVEF